MKLLKTEQIELNRHLFSAAEVDKFLDKYYPQAEVSTVPYSAEDGQPRVMLNRGESYCSLNLPLSGADLLYHTTLLVVFGKKE